MAALYESNLVAELAYVQQNQHEASCSVVTGTRLCVVTGDLVQVVALSAASEPTLFKFECAVDCVGLSEDDTLLVAGDRQGVLHFVSPSLQSEVLFSQDVGLNSASEDNKVFSCISFSSANGHLMWTLCVLCTNGVVLMFNNLPLQQLRKALESNDLQLMKQFKEGIQLTRLDVSSEHDIRSSFLLPMPTPTLFINANFVTSGRGSSGLCIWGERDGGELELVDNVSRLLKGVCVTRCGVTEDFKYLVTLTNAGMLSVWQLSSLIMINVWASGTGVSHYTLAKGTTNILEGRASGCSDRVCFIKDSSDGKNLVLASLPGLQVLYTRPVSSHAGLVQGRATEDSLYFTEDGSDGVTVKHLMQASPEKRLATLLSAGKFTEAEELARHYSLDAQLVYRTKAQVLNKQWIEKHSTGEDGSDTYTDFVQCVQSVKDTVFISELVLSSHYPTLKLTLDTLHLAKKMLKQTSDKSSQVKTAQLKVLSALNKLITFQMVYSEEGFKTEEWHSFLNGNLMDYLKAYFLTGNLKKISTLWNRHLGELMENLASGDFIDLLSSLPESLSSAKLGVWLATSVVPFILQHAPDSLTFFLEWVQRRARLLELSEKEHWPSNGLLLCSQVLDALSSRSPVSKLALRNSPFTLDDSMTDKHSALNGLRSLQQSLQDISYLQGSHQCSVSLSEHEKESKDGIVFRLLDQAVAAELVSTTIKHKVTPYVEKHRLDLNQVLLSYLKLFLSQSPRFSTSLTDSPYEAKAIALVKAIKDEELYVSGCIELLKYVHTPWSEGVEELVHECLKVDHSHVATLKKQYQLLQLKKLLHGYGIRNVNFSDTTSSYSRLYIHRILSSDGSTVMEDALKIAAVYDIDQTEVYKKHVFNLGMKDQTIRAGEVLRSLPTPEQIATAQSVFKRASTKLDSSFQRGLDDPEEYTLSARLALLCLAVLKDTACNGECTLCENWLNIEDTISLYSRLLSLQVEFSLFLSPCVLDDKERCHQLFEEGVDKFIQEAKLATNTKNVHRASRYALLLGFSEKEFFQAVATKYAKSNDIHKAKEICWHLMRRGPKECPAQLLLYTVQQWWISIKADPRAVSERDTQELRKLASEAVARVDRDLLLSVLEVHKGCVLLQAIHSQCESSGDLEESTKSQGFRSVVPAPFREDGLVLDQTVVLPAAVEFAQATVPFLSVDRSSGSRRVSVAYSGDAQCVQGVLDRCSSLSQSLQDNGHLQLAVLCTLQGLYSFFQQSGVSEVKPQVLSEQQKQLAGMLMTLIGKVLSCRKLDHNYGLSLLLTLGPSVATQKLQGIRFKSISSYSRVITLCNLAMDYSHIIGQPQLLTQVESIKKSAEWGKKLSNVKISYTEAFRGGLEEKKQVSTALFRSKMVDIETVIQYCSEVLDNIPQSVLLAYLKVVVSEWAESQEALERAAAILPLITNYQLVQQLLAKLLATDVSPYDYERVAFILQQLANGQHTGPLKVEQGLLLLDCLKCYTRESPPSEYERSWYTTHCNLSVSAQEDTLAESELQLPAQSAERLPFHCLLYDTPMEIIGNELTSTIRIAQLRPVAAILKVEGDTFYSVGIKNVVLASRDNNVTSVTDLLGYIKSATLALNITKWLAKQLKTDTERMEALKTAVTIAYKWKEQARMNESDASLANEKIQMFTKLLRITQTDQLLRQNSLDDFLELSVQGASLIMKLYTDIPVSSRKPIPGVHALAAEIARIHNISLDKIKHKLTEMWLMSTKAESKDMDVTQMSMMEDPTEGGDMGDSEEEMNLRRLKYLLNTPDKLEENASMLLHWAKHTSTASTTDNLSRVKALQVLFAIAPDSLIEKVSGTTAAEVRDYMQSALFASELERLHMSTSVSAFQSCSKEGLVKSLWRNHSQEPRALRLIGELCLHYSIKDGSLWSKLLQALMTLGMLPYLRHILRALSSSPDLLWTDQIPLLSSIWQDVILFPFQNVVPPLTPFQQDECIESFNMIMGCPLLFEFDVARIIEGFSSVGLLGHAIAVSLAIVGQRDRQLALKTMLDNLDSKALIKFLDELSNCPKLRNYISEVEQLVYLYVNSSGRHQALLGSSHFTSYVHFLVSRKMIDELLAKTLEANKVTEAVQLVELYNHHHNLSTLSGLDLLKVYVDASNLSMELKEYVELVATESDWVR